MGRRKLVRRREKEDRSVPDANLELDGNIFL